MDEEHDEMDENELAYILEDQYNIMSANEVNEVEIEDGQKDMTAESENELQQNNEQQIEQENMEGDNVYDDNYQSEEDNEDNEEYQHQQHDMEDNQNVNPELRRSTQRRDVPTRTGIFYSHLHKSDNNKQ